jgi:hypothetical protein
MSIFPIVWTRTVTADQHWGNILAFRLSAGNQAFTSTIREQWPLHPAACLQGLPTQHHPRPSQVIHLAHRGAMILFGKAPAEVLEVVGAWRNPINDDSTPNPPASGRAATA